MDVRVESVVSEAPTGACARADQLRAGAAELLSLADTEQRRADQLRMTAQLLLEHAHELDEISGRAPQLRLGGVAISAYG